ncbi:putative glycosyltransferase [Camellia lanceoleosa]|uniref:Glycosyltransferase n=1 Tax=Camellia lanceoleosa TaxID=1840588 RepID=A0ACC0H1B1_9ERIC|nr:putative glycosyltransferase [Camellia lanceoleosa]
MAVSELTSAQQCNDDFGVRLNGHLDGHVVTSGYMKSLSGPIKSWPEVHLEALDLKDTSKELDKGLSKQLMHAATSDRKKARQRRRSWKLPFSARRRGHSEAVARRNSQKEALFRSASAALSRSLANRDNSRSRGSAGILNEAQATLCMGKLLGVEFGQDEESIVNRIVQLEQQDKEKVGVRLGSPSRNVAVLATILVVFGLQCSYSLPVNEELDWPPNLEGSLVLNSSLAHTLQAEETALQSLHDKKQEGVEDKYGLRRSKKRDAKLKRVEASLAGARALIRNAMINQNRSSPLQDSDYIPNGDIYRNAYDFHRK